MSVSNPVNSSVPILPAAIERCAALAFATIAPIGLLTSCESDAASSPITATRPTRASSMFWSWCCSSASLRAVMSITETFWNQRFDITADQLAERIAEDSCGLRVGEVDHTGGVDHEHRVRRGIE